MSSILVWCIVAATMLGGNMFLVMGIRIIMTIMILVMGIMMMVMRIMILIKNGNYQEDEGNNWG